MGFVLELTPGRKTGLVHLPAVTTAAPNSRLAYPAVHTSQTPMEAQRPPRHPLLKLDPRHHQLRHHLIPAFRNVVEGQAERLDLIRSPPAHLWAYSAHA